MNSRSISPHPLKTVPTLNSYRLKKRPDGSAVLCRSWFSIVLLTLFYLSGIMMLIAAPRSENHKGLVFGLALILIALWSSWRRQTVRIDPGNGELTLGRSKIPFARIAAFQIVRHDNPRSYQLNLVAADGERTNLIAFANGNKIRDIARELAHMAGAKVFDREQETEPVAADGVIRAENICWPPLTTDWIGIRQRTHKLIRKPDGRYVFVPSLRGPGLWLTLFFSFGGAAIAAIGIYFLWKGDREQGIPLIVAGLFFALPLWLPHLARYAGMPVFDPENQIFFRGRRRNEIPLGDIIAFQVLSQYHYIRRGANYTSYELNLVLKDGRRVNVVAHGDSEQLWRDAQTLANRFRVPLLSRNELN